MPGPAVHGSRRAGLRAGLPVLPAAARRAAAVVSSTGTAAASSGRDTVSMVGCLAMALIMALVVSAPLAAANPSSAPPPKAGARQPQPAGAPAPAPDDDEAGGAGVDGSPAPAQPAVKALAGGASSRSPAATATAASSRLSTSSPTAKGAVLRGASASAGAVAPGAAAAPAARDPLPVLAAVSSKGLRVRLEAGIEARLSGDGQISIEAVPRTGEGIAGFALRLCGDTRLWPQVLESNGQSEKPEQAKQRERGAQRTRQAQRERQPQRPDVRLLAGRRYHLAFEILSAGWQLKAAQALFPEDRGDATGWRHQVRGLGALRRENLWQLSEWFTGKGENFRAIREYNNLRDEDVAQGAVLTIPSELLRPAFGAALPVPQRPYVLDYGKDDEGEYAIYRLRPGEALYSGVVVRFTGRIYAADVNTLAADIAHRSGIEDVTAIPVGFKVKIPLDLLQPEFLPEGDPRRKEYEAGLRASSQFSNQVHARGLEGITVILDAGHGGHDSGATMAGVWESLYVYDISLRLKRLLESRTAAAVDLTTRDGDDFRIVDADVLPESRRHAVLTNPPYPIEDPVVGVNLRWYLANSFFRRALTADNDTQKVVFLSIHADSLHPSLRGAMAYIPAARMRDESYGKSGAIYEARQEFRESPRVEFPHSQRVQSEGLSRQLAKQVIGAFEELGLPVHPFTPVRDHIIRNHAEWVPAVLRFNSVPAKMLLEVCNLNNDLDRRLLQTRSYRQHVAEAVLQGLLAYYGQSDAPPPVRLARTSK